MRVHLIDIDQGTGAETYRTTCQLSECFPDAGPSDEDYAEIGEAIINLATTGRHRLGGGAAPLVLLLNAATHWVGYEDDYGLPGGRTTRLSVIYGR